MRTDQELRELSAKAAGLWDFENNCVDIPWDALTRNGDAFWLAVKLQLNIEASTTQRKFVAVRTSNLNWMEWRESTVDRDPEECTRRAIVRAAAEIGALSTTALEQGGK